MNTTYTNMNPRDESPLYLSRQVTAGLRPDLPWQSGDAETITKAIWKDFDPEHMVAVLESQGTVLQRWEVE